MEGLEESCLTFLINVPNVPMSTQKKRAATQTGAGSTSSILAPPRLPLQFLTELIISLETPLSVKVITIGSLGAVRYFSTTAYKNKALRITSDFATHFFLASLSIKSMSCLINAE